MAEIILLGTGAALPGSDRENTYLVVQGKQSALLVDCAGSPVHRLARARVGLDQIDDMILTHDHADHLYGFPIFIMDLWLAGRKKELNVFGLAPTLQTAQALLATFQADTWENLFPINYCTISADQIELILITPEFTVSATTSVHYVPTVSIRIMCKDSGRTIVYSSDTTPSDPLIELARGSDILFHEATFLDKSTAGHTNAFQAGAQAERAQVKKLVLLHLPPDVDPKAWRAAARTHFHGPVRVARDLDRFAF